ncbi:hypothetical protein SASPL_145245 [Salvia splendens]|uniref:HAT C-terminal dimerisation domain-containing protein n=1 Tax=Salvia splendens TaxID=180675 RepID=A0A8X8WH95_SALSN|nr:hypothetical protein SASPL_145245 [Salvia splendens]
MTQYVIKDEVCFRAVEKPGFVALVNELEPRFQMPNQKKVAEYKGVNDTVLNQTPLLECEDVGDSSNKGVTVASKSSFSLGKRVVDPFRTCLSPKMVEALVCTIDDDLEIYREIEEIEKNPNMSQDAFKAISPT